jgi:hypothetical protein
VGLAGRCGGTAPDTLDHRHHRLDHGQHIALHQQRGVLGQGIGQRQHQLGLQHPALVMLLLEPGVGELDRDPLQQPGRQRPEPGLQAHVGVCEEIAQIAELQRLPVGFSRLDQGSADLQAQVIPERLALGHGQQKASACGADVEMQGQGRLRKQLGRRRQRPWQLVEPAQRVDVLAHHQPLGTTNPQLAV